MTIVVLAIATALAAAAGDVVVESILDAGDRIVAFGGNVAIDMSTTTKLTVLTSLAAGAALVWVTAIALARGRRLEHRMADELDARWDAQSRHNAGVEGRNKLLEYRVAELQTKLEDLSGKRDALVGEIRAVRRRTSELQNIAHEQSETIARLTGATQVDDLLVVPEPADEASEDEMTAGGGGGGFDDPEEAPASGAQAVERRTGSPDEIRPLSS
jgi:predicted nuclease with TOPRIM domain